MSEEIQEFLKELNTELKITVNQLRDFYINSGRLDEYDDRHQWTDEDILDYALNDEGWLIEYANYEILQMAIKGLLNVNKK